MDATQFTQRAKQDPQLNAFLKEIAEDASKQISVEEPQRFLTVTGVDILIAIAAYALYRWLKDYFDHRRALKEVEILKQQEQIIAALIKDGFPPGDARVVTVALLKQIAKRNADDPVLKAAAGLIGKVS